MEDIIALLLLNYHKYVEEIYSYILQYWPRLDNYNHFDKFVILNLIIIAVYLIINTISSFSIVRIYRRVMKTIFSFGPIKGKVQV